MFILYYFMKENKQTKWNITYCVEIPVTFVHRIVQRTRPDIYICSLVHPGILHFYTPSSSSLDTWLKCVQIKWKYSNVATKNIWIFSTMEDRNTIKIVTNEHQETL